MGGNLSTNVDNSDITSEVLNTVSTKFNEKCTNKYHITARNIQNAR